MPRRWTRSRSGLALVRPSSRRSALPMPLRVSSTPRTPASTLWCAPSRTRPRSGTSSSPTSRWLARPCRRISSIPSSYTPLPRRIISLRWSSSSTDPTWPTSRILATDASTRACTMRPRSSSPASTTTPSSLCATSTSRSTARPSPLLPRPTMFPPGSRFALPAFALRSSVLLLLAVLRSSSTPTTSMRLLRTTPTLATSPTSSRCSSRDLVSRMLTLVSLLSWAFSTPSTCPTRLWSIARCSSASSMLARLSVLASGLVCSPRPCTFTWRTSSTTTPSK
mmetsp:Transcript_27593/g.79609  ORF Transcript_27593/g.79609 Transcript_27593/m.79609 type:complete len:280 (+) Transcript_27593:3600-4439(+)